MTKPRVFLLVENPRKCSNLGPMLRCAAAYGITKVLAVGYAQCSVDGSHGASKYVTIEAFATVEQAVDHLRQGQGQQGQQQKVSFVGILGGMPVATNSATKAVYDIVEGNVELPNHNNNNNGTGIASSSSAAETRKVVFPSSTKMDTTTSTTTTTSKKSYAVGSRPFDASATIHCFVFSKFNWGMPSSLARVCDFFVHIPHRSCIVPSTTRTPTEGPPPQILDRHACLSIVLHHFCEWAGYEERSLDGHKYQVDKTTSNTTTTTTNSQSQRLALHEQRQRHKQALQEEIHQTETTPEATGVVLFANSQQQEQDGDY